MTQLPAVGYYHDIIAQIASAPDSDKKLDAIERLVAVNETIEVRAGEKLFNDNFAKAQAEVDPVIRDSRNDQVRRPFASHKAIAEVLHPVMAKYGFGVSFSTEALDSQDWVRVIGHLSHGIITRRYPYDAPIETTGAKGTQFTTKQWARASAITFAKRQILIAMWDLMISDGDNDGQRLPPPSNSNVRAQPQEVSLIDHVTGEVFEKPVAISRVDNEYREWARQFIGCCSKLAKTIDDVERWESINVDGIEALQKAEPDLFATVLSRLKGIKDRINETT